VQAQWAERAQELNWDEPVTDAPFSSAEEWRARGGKTKRDQRTKIMNLGKEVAAIVTPHCDRAAAAPTLNGAAVILIV
jgi:hypothetical protein